MSPSDFDSDSLGSDDESLSEYSINNQSIILKYMMMDYLKGKYDKNNDMNNILSDVHNNDQNACYHYISKCSIVASCCGSIFPCKKCHNEEKDHKILPKDIKYIICKNCTIEQKVSNECISCGITFGEYYCNRCKIHDNDDGMKYHCNECDMCLIGDKNKTFHCDGCKCCLDIHLEYNHECRQNRLIDDCVICLEKLLEKQLTMIQCGHIFHEKCISGLLETSNRCPICRGVIYL